MPAEAVLEKSFRLDLYLPRLLRGPISKPQRTSARMYANAERVTDGESGADSSHNRTLPANKPLKIAERVWSAMCFLAAHA